MRMDRKEVPESQGQAGVGVAKCSAQGPHGGHNGQGLILYTNQSVIFNYKLL